MLRKMREGEYVGGKPGKGEWSEMFPREADGLTLAAFVRKLPQVLDVFAKADPHNLDGCALGGFPSGVRSTSHELALPDPCSNVQTRPGGCSPNEPCPNGSHVQWR